MEVALLRPVPGLDDAAVAAVRKWGLLLRSIRLMKNQSTDDTGQPALQRDLTNGKPAMNR